MSAKASRLAHTGPARNAHTEPGDFAACGANQAPHDFIQVATESLLEGRQACWLIGPLDQGRSAQDKSCSLPLPRGFRRKECDGAGAYCMAMSRGRTSRSIAPVHGPVGRPWWPKGGRHDVGVATTNARPRATYASTKRAPPRTTCGDPTARVDKCRSKAGTDRPVSLRASWLRYRVSASRPDNLGIASPPTTPSCAIVPGEKVQPNTRGLKPAL